MKPKDIIAEYLRTALVDDGVINNVPQTVMAEGLLHALETRGFVVVPEAPADAMIIAGGGAQQRSIGSWGEPRLVYRAMLAAAQLNESETKEDSRE